MRMATKKVNRSAVTGRFVTTKAVKRSPRTTVTQTVRVPKGAKRK